MQFLHFFFGISKKSSNFAIENRAHIGRRDIVKRLIINQKICSMNKSELVAAVAAKAEMSKAAAAKAVEATFEAMAKALKNGENVQLIGFGSFAVVKKAARQGINPATKAPITIPAKNVVRFRAGAKLAL